MVESILIMIGLFWLTVALLNFGIGEAKGTGFIAGAVGLLAVAGGFVDTIRAGGLAGGLLFSHGLLYMSIAYALLFGVENMKSIGSISLATAFVSTIYMFVWWSQGLGYLAFMAAGYAVLTYEVWLNFFGKLSGKVLAISLLIWIPVGLWIPAFLLGMGKALPF
jgi:hypothetical protein